MIEVKRPSEKPLRNQDYAERKVESLQNEGKESRTKWKRDKGDTPPGWNSNYTWKTISKQKYASEAYVVGYEKINWGK